MIAENKFNWNDVPVEPGHLDDIQPGDLVVRSLAGAPMELQVTEVQDGIITCSYWTMIR